ncbi:MAG: molybdopterin-binding protein [Chitinivibrionales bacterium]|nr:molybdopterin-binding protein [Chitinivibrionales bacterium]
MSTKLRLLTYRDVPVSDGDPVIRKAAIIPTGDEIVEGVVVDTNSPAIRDLILHTFPDCAIALCSPCSDIAEVIAAAIERQIEERCDCIVLIGGCGEGHCRCPGLGIDVTPRAIENVLKEYWTRDIYGSNGHRWARIMAGRAGNSLVVNVPGPYVEACAAAEALLAVLKQGDWECRSIAEACAEAVITQYPPGSISS